MGFLGKWFGSSKKGGQAAPKPRRKKLKRINIEKRFKLYNRLGQGSMSRVWRATDLKSGRLVCVKVLDKEKTDQLKKRFVGMNRPDEGDVALGLNHPNIVRTFEYGMTTRGEEYLVMEFLDAVGLSYLIETRSSHLAGLEVEILVGAGEGLAYFHQQGYIHRDICPRNIMVTKQNAVKLIDFGLAVPNIPEFRRPGNRTGTANYMAPELIRRAPTDQRIDIFSFGVTAYETVTGNLPWERADTLQGMLTHLNSPPRDPREFRPRLSERVVTVLLKGIERDVNLRYQSMGEFVGELRRLIGKGSD